MTFFCYVYSRDSDVPHMEALGSPTLADAKARARRMLDEHAATMRAELFHDDLRVAIIAPDEIDCAHASG
ncbi:hypothetical protein [Caulobacter sp.]|uniref:hypothetical protein n=1 Tax=Caulobacter sp. TaxID=78 RepID=UPI003BAD6525